MDDGEKFVVANGTKTMSDTAFNWCPDIHVDLNGITKIPIAAFFRSDVVSVDAPNVTQIGVNAFAECPALVEFNFNESGVFIGEQAFKGANLSEIHIPRNTTIESRAFAEQRSVVQELSVLMTGELIAFTPHDAFLNTELFKFTLKAEDTATRIAAESYIADAWTHGTDHSGDWKFKGSNEIKWVKIDNQKLPDGEKVFLYFLFAPYYEYDSSGNPIISEDVSRQLDRRVEIVDISKVETESIFINDKFRHPFVEHHPDMTEDRIRKYCDSIGFDYDSGVADGFGNYLPSHKSGVYAPLMAGSPTAPIFTHPDGESIAYAGDGRTWELVQEYYVVHYWSFPTDGDADSDGTTDGKDPDYDNNDMFGDVAGVRTEVGSAEFLEGEEMRLLLWPEFVKYSLSGWYAVPHDEDGAIEERINKSRLVTVQSIVGNESSIPEEWIYRDENDIGHLNIYAVFAGKEYSIILESRVSTGRNSPTFMDHLVNPTGGVVELVLDEEHFGSTGFSTGSTGAKEGSYPYGTGMTIRAIPNTGYAFVGWVIVDITDPGSMRELSFKRDDRKYVNATGNDRIAVHPNDEVQSNLKYAALFARTTTVEFHYNFEEDPLVQSVTYVAGDRLVEPSNDYNSHDYAALALQHVEELYLGEGTDYYPGTPSGTSNVSILGNHKSTKLIFEGWYTGITSGTCYGRPFADGQIGTDSGGNRYDIWDLTSIPTQSNALVLYARWTAVLTFNPDDSINDGDLPATTTLTETAADSGIYTYRHNVGEYYPTLQRYSRALTYHNNANFLPTADNVVFNGWYILETAGGTSADDVLDNATGTNNSTVRYPNAYSTKNRMESGGYEIYGHTSLIALYTADVTFYFNGATAVGSTVSTPVPYRVSAPVSVTTMMGDAAFGVIHAAMQNADTTGSTYKNDTKSVRMKFMGWYPSEDGTTPPTSSSAPYNDSTQITANTRLIAGWGITVTFDDRGVENIVDENNSNAEWVPAEYSFTVLEGTIFDEEYAGASRQTSMPDVSQEGKDPTSWYDGTSLPYTWFDDDNTAYTYSVILTPEFQSLFQFNMMGGNLGIVQVPYSMSENFGIILERFFDNTYVNSQYLELTKAGLYYKNNGSSRDAGERPNAVWYMGDTSGETTVAPDYVNAPDTSLHEWNTNAIVGSEANAYAYIRWLADVNFDINVPQSAEDPGTTPDPRPFIGLDEGTTFQSLASEMPPVPKYNTAGGKSFKGWYVGMVKYTNQDGTLLAEAPDVTRSITLTASWNIEVKFYYNGTITNPSIGTLGSDSEGTYIIVEASNTNMVTAPRLTKAGFTAQQFLWFTGGWDADVPVNVQNFVPLNTPSAFNPNVAVTENTAVYVRWYATVTFTLTGGGTTGGFFDNYKYILEGSKLSDLEFDLNPYLDDPQREDWIFIGWFEAPPSSVNYETLGAQYYRTSFDYLPDDGITPSDDESLTFTRNITLRYEYVVPVHFDGGYDSAAEISMKYLRTNRPIPSNGPRFTSKPDRAGGTVTFMGWTDLSTNQKYTVDTRNSDAPNTRNVMGEMTLTALWLISVSFYDLEEYMQNGIQITTTSMITQVRGPDNTLNTNDDFFEMPEGTAIRQLIAADPSASGKTFVSWFVEGGEADGLYADGDVLYGLTDRIRSDVKLTAGYGHLISFDTNGGIPSVIAGRMVIEGQSIVLPEMPVKGNRTFMGWNDGDAAYDASTTVTPMEDTTYAAKWQVVVSLFDGISMKPMRMVWDEDDGPDFEYSTKLDSDYDAEYEMDYGGRVLSAKITYTPAGGSPTEIIVEKFIDRYDGEAAGWVSYHSTFDGWLDPLSGYRIGADENLEDLFGTGRDLGSVSLFAVWKERVRYYDGGDTPTVDYVDTGDYLGVTAPASSGGWADSFNPTEVLNPDTYRIKDSMDFVAVELITVTFSADGGTPALQEFQDVVSGTMMGAVGAEEPTKNGQFFAGWYLGDERFSFTDRLYGDITLTAKWQSAGSDRHTIFAIASQNAHLSPSGAIQAFKGDTVTFSFYADKGYTVSVLIDGNLINSDDLSSYTFRNVTSDHSIEVRSYHTDSRNATEYLTVGIDGNGGVLYSSNGGESFISYTSPLPLYSGVDYILRATPGATSYFEGWTGDVTSIYPEVTVSWDGTDEYVYATFKTESYGILGSGGEMAVLNLICAVISIIVGLTALTVSHLRNHDGTGTGKTMRFAALFLSILSLVLLVLTQGFGGTYVAYDEWTVVMAVIMVAIIILALASIRHDHVRD
ncbi:MAG: InlB B-repeat-containing protein [Candidatus Methanoplasma sp.]|nr:InlB B-repeat-containing protein [Candidatus Methanoplasma sp.]